MQRGGKHMPYSDLQKFCLKEKFFNISCITKWSGVCKGLTGIEQTSVLWKGGDSIDEEVKVWDMEFCIKHVIVVPFEDVYFTTCHKEFVV